MFKLHSNFTPTGDQPEAIEYLVNGIKQGKKFQTLLGVTGSRKNFYYGKCYCKSAKTNSNTCTEQIVGTVNFIQSSKNSFQKTV